MVGSVHINDEIKLHHLWPMESPEDLYTYYIHENLPPPHPHPNTHTLTVRLACDPHYNGEKNETQTGQLPFPRSRH